MPFKFDYVDGAVLEWSLTPDGVAVERNESYTPTFYVSTHGSADRSTVAQTLREHPRVAHVRTVEERVGFRPDPEPVLRVDVGDLSAVTTLASTATGWARPGDVRCYNVDFSREFRYCLERGVDPSPARDPRVLELAVAEPQLAGGTVRELVVGDEDVEGSPRDVLDALSARLDAVDPDVLLLNTSELIPVLFEQAERVGVDDFRLGRLPDVDYQHLAGESTYTSYGRVGHSPARYNLPGRAIIDRSNTFFWSQTNVEGSLDLVRRSGKPLQELAWSSIGTILTAIQIREARSRGVLVPWHSWRHEQFKTMSQLRTADRGGFTFAPKVGLHEDVHELDFSSLYPNIIATRNVSPEKIRCDCHADREDVPGLGYAICDEAGYLPGLLATLIEDRDAVKARLKEVDDPTERAALEGKASAIKWILVSCFGYQGFSNAKFGRIECHEAINAFAREILLDAKETLETNGWDVVHGIVDSLWVTPVEGETQTPLDEVTGAISKGVEIELEYEARYDWVAFVPTRTSDAGALTKYFGKLADENDYKYRGIECRQHSTPRFVADAQKDLIATLDAHRDPEAVCDRLEGWIRRLRVGDVDVSDLVVANRVSKSLDDYCQRTRTVAALERVRSRGLRRQPGQRVEYVVVDDDRESADRVALAWEAPDSYDVAFYRELLVRAAESVVSPLGWREARIERHLADHRDVSLAAYTDSP